MGSLLSKLNPFGGKKAISRYFLNFLKFLKIRLLPLRFVIPAQAGIQED